MFNPDDFKAPPLTVIVDGKLTLWTNINDVMKYTIVNGSVITVCGDLVCVNNKPHNDVVIKNNRLNIILTPREEIPFPKEEVVNETYTIQKDEKFFIEYQCSECGCGKGNREVTLNQFNTRKGVIRNDFSMYDREALMGDHVVLKVKLVTSAYSCCRSLV